MTPDDVIHNTHSQNGIWSRPVSQEKLELISHLQPGPPVFQSYHPRANPQFLAPTLRRSILDVRPVPDTLGDILADMHLLPTPGAQVPQGPQHLARDRRGGSSKAASNQNERHSEAKRECRFRSEKNSRKGSECPIDELEDPNPAENILHQEPKQPAT